MVAVAILDERCCMAAATARLPSVNSESTHAAVTESLEDCIRAKLLRLRCIFRSRRENEHWQSARARDRESARESEREPERG